MQFDDSEIKEDGPDLHRDQVDPDWERLFLCDLDDNNSVKWLQPELGYWPREEPEQPPLFMNLATVGVLWDEGEGKEDFDGRHWELLSYMRYFRSMEMFEKWKAGWSPEEAKKYKRLWRLFAERGAGWTPEEAQKQSALPLSDWQLFKLPEIQARLYHWQLLTPYPFKIMEIGRGKFRPDEGYGTGIPKIWKRLLPTIRKLERLIKLGPRDTVVDHKEARNTKAKLDGFLFKVPWDDREHFIKADRIMNTFYPVRRVCTSVTEVLSPGDDLKALSALIYRCYGTTAMNVGGQADEEPGQERNPQGWEIPIDAHRLVMENTPDYKKASVDQEFKRRWTERSKLFQIVYTAVNKEARKADLFSEEEKKHFAGVIDDVLAIVASEHSDAGQRQRNVLNRLRRVMLGQKQSIKDEAEWLPWRLDVSLHPLIAGFINNLIWRQTSPHWSWQNRLWVVWTGRIYNRHHAADREALQVRLTHGRSWSDKEFGRVMEDVYAHHRENLSKTVSLTFQPEFRQLQEIKQGLDLAAEEEAEAKRRGGKDVAQQKRLVKLINSISSKRRSARNYVPPRNLLPKFTRQLILSFVGARYRVREK